MPYVTLRFERAMNAAELAAVERVVRARGATIVLRSSARCARTYGLLDAVHGTTVDAIRTATSATAYDGAIIALAVYPVPVEALPALLNALGGSGRPAGVLECALCGDGVVVEWDPERASAELIRTLVDVELRRFGATRTAELLSPLPEAVVARICAEGLSAPEVTPERILETLVDKAEL
jgi:hypothetical protein